MEVKMTEQEIQKIIKEERNKYAKEWRAKNPDKVKANNERYWLRKAEKLAAEREG
jgi:hypothetical protein